MQSVTLVPYQSLWPAQFGEVAAELALSFAGVPARIEHIGSTSVPGLCAKPVLDVLLGVRDLSAVETHAGALASLGYAYRPEYEVEIPHRRYFVRPEGRLPRVHLHAVVQGGRLWVSHLAFRDALGTDPALRLEYAALKRELADRYRHDKAAYTDAKAPFIAGVLAKCSLPEEETGGGPGSRS